MAELLIIGTGLIGTSFALAARSAGCFERTVGFDADGAALETAHARGAVDAVAADFARAVADADAIFVAVPPAATGRMVVDVTQAGPKPAAVVFDGASIKGAVIRDVRARLGSLPAGYVPAHPMAGSEQRGAVAASADLFVGSSVFVTPELETAAAAVARVTSLWQALGAEVHVVGAERHDALASLVSHLPHLLAADFMAWLGEQAPPPLPFAGRGLRDFTRIAGSDPAMWRQIFEGNREAVLGQLDEFIAVLGHLRKLLEQNRFDALESMLTQARRARQSLDEPAGQTARHDD